MLKIFLIIGLFFLGMLINYRKERFKNESAFCLIKSDNVYILYANYICETDLPGIFVLK